MVEEWVTDGSAGGSPFLFARTERTLFFIDKTSALVEQHCDFVELKEQVNVLPE